MPNDEDLTRIERYGLYLQDENKAIVGTPILQGILPMMKIRAADIHSSYIEIFITIKIDDYLPKRRSSYTSKIYLDNIYITESSNFEF